MKILDTKTKVLIGICSGLALLCIVFYIILGFFEVEEEEVVVYPAGGLSQSVFDSQNIVYVGTESYTTQHPFYNIPYTVDTVDGARANIGRGAFYNKEPYYFYCSELLTTESMEGAIKAELTDVLSLTADELKTSVEVLSQEHGYINGCEATFFVLRITADTKTAYMCLYRLHMNESTYDSDWDMLIGCMNIMDVADTSSLGNLQTLAITGVKTLRYNESQEKVLKRIEEEKLKAESEGKKEEEQQVEGVENTEVGEPSVNVEDAEGVGAESAENTESVESAEPEV